MPVFKFTLLHFAAFTAFGLASALVIAAAEREPLLILGALMVYACFEVSFLAFVTIQDSSALGAIGWWNATTRWRSAIVSNSRATSWSTDVRALADSSNRVPAD